MKKILVIEDDAAIRGLIEEALKLRSWLVLSAVDGEAGLELAREERPDLILCDIQMPKMDGFEVLRAAKQLPALATVPFVFLTGLSDRPRVRQAMELGADDYLGKPFTILELLAAVDAQFHKEALRDKTAEQKLGELRGSLTFALPHELVTPLNSILGFSSLILESPGGADVREYALLIRNAGERLKELIEKFLIYAQIELAAADSAYRNAAAEGPRSETADVIINAAERAAQQSKRPSDLRLTIEPAQHPVQSSHLSRLVQELLENAFKFSEPGTSVSVKSTRENGAFVLTVSDNGRGFQPEQLRKAGQHLQFDRQLQEQQGTGLGLAICRRIADLYGGTLEIESIPAERTCVSLRLPA